MTKPIIWSLTYRAPIAQGMALIAIPKTLDTPNIRVNAKDLQTFGTLVAMEVMGRWYWVGRSSTTRTMRFVSEFKADEVDRVSRTKLCNHRVDTQGPLRLVPL